MSEPLHAFVAAVRKACPAPVWSQGVILAREERVTQESRDEDEVVLRVMAPTRPMALTVVLYPEDREWDCDCGGAARVCAHVAAAAITVGQAEKRGEEVTARDAAGVRVRYRLARVAGGLSLDRYLGDELLETALSSRVTGRVAGAPVVADEADLRVDSMLSTRRGGAIPPERIARYLEVLGDCEDVRLEGEPIRTSGEPVYPRAVVEDEGEGVRLTIDRDPAVTEVVALGVVRCGDTLRPIGEVRLSGGRLEELPITHLFPAEELGDLVTKYLPGIPETVDLDVRTSRLPGTTRSVRPRIHMQIEHDGPTLAVMPLLVYGDPPQARIDDGRLVHLGGDVPVRNIGAERDLVHRLRAELHLVPGRKVEFRGHEAIAFANTLAAWRGDLVRESALPRTTSNPLVPRIDIDGEQLDAWFETEVAGRARRADAGAVIRAWRDGLDLVPLDGGGWAPLPAEWLERHGHRVADLLAARTAEGKVHTFALPDLARLCEDLDHPPPPRLETLRPLIDGFDRLPPAEIPGDLEATLRPYQTIGIRWLGFLRDAGLGALLADDMGLGKTLQALCVMRGRSLVVCPRSILHNWENEAHRFRPGMRVAVYHGPKRDLDPEADLTITTYALLRNDRDRLGGIRWDTVVLDEAQAIKNPDSQAARAAYELDAAFRITLSGTPVENRLDELWSQLHFTNPGLLGGRADFQDRYARPIARGEDGAAERLRQRIRPFVLRRLKRDVAPELPPRTDSILHVDLDDDERVVYDAVRAATRDEIVRALGEGGSVFAALEALLRLRQAACHPSLLPGQEAATSSKVERLVSALDEITAEGHKALVFSQWTSLLDLIEPHLHGASIPFSRLDGSTRDRASVVDGFQADDGPPVMLVSLKAGGTGLNLTAADHVFLVDPWWNPAVEDQAADRTHRIGQDKPVLVYRMVAVDTVEERILALQERKRGLADAALGDADRAASLTREDLMMLLQ